VHAGSAHHGGRRGSRRTPGFRLTRRPKAVVWAHGDAHGTREPRARGDGLIGDGANDGGAVPPPAGCSRSGRVAASKELQEPPCCDVATYSVAAADEKPIQTDRCRRRRTIDPTSHPRESCDFRWTARRRKGFLGRLAPCPNLNWWCM